MERLTANLLFVLALVLAGCNSSNTNSSGDQDLAGLDPSDPSEPSDPSDPSDPSEPSDPSDPDSPVAPEPEPPVTSTVLFTGSDFGYQDDDPRHGYTVRAESYVAARAAIEAKYALSFYTTVTASSHSDWQLESILASCPSSGSYWASERCNYYVDLAHKKTLAQDGWQNEIYPFVTDAIVCEYTMIHGECFYILENRGSGSFASEAPEGLDYLLKTPFKITRISPIESWNYLRHSDSIRGINDAILDHGQCAGINDTDWLTYNGPGLWHISFWPGQYFVTWTVIDDTYGDVFRDITATTPLHSGCNTEFRLALEEVYGGVW